MAAHAPTAQPEPGPRDVRVHPVTLAFDDADLEAAFRASWDRRSLPAIRVATLLGMGLYSLFALVDLAVVPEAVRVTWFIRFGVVGPAAIALLLASRTAWGLAHLQVLMWGAGVTGGLGIVAIIILAGEAGQTYYSAGILLITAYLGLFTRLRFMPAATAIAVVLAAYLVSVVAWVDMPIVAALNMAAFTVSIAIVSTTGAYAFERAARADYVRQRVIERQADHLARALADVRELSGLIPICAWCKRIRDDDGYWRQLESYISDHSRASFSHGMCPDCYARQDGGEAPAPSA